MKFYQTNETELVNLSLVESINIDIWNEDEDEKPRLVLEARDGIYYSYFESIEECHAEFYRITEHLRL